MCRMRFKAPRDLPTLRYLKHSKASYGRTAFEAVGNERLTATDSSYTSISEGSWFRHEMLPVAWNPPEGWVEFRVLKD